MNAPLPAIPVLILAAGASRRMGRPKQLLSWGRGTLLDQAIRQARAISPCVVVVAGAHYPLVRFRSRCAPARWVYAAEWAGGMSASLRAGLQSLPAGSPGTIVMVADQPLLSSGGLAELAMAASTSPAQIVAADYRGFPGVPAYLPKTLWPELTTLTGDQGAGAVLRRHSVRRLVIGGVDDDADTPSDWQRLKRL